MNHYLLTENWYNHKHNSKEEEEFHVLKAVSEIIWREIRSQVYDNQNCRPSDKMFEDIG